MNDWKQMIREGFPKLHILILGDVMVDEYVTGRVSRISPEAPIPVLDYGTCTRIAGGASNVAHNIAKLGSSAFMFGVIGEDEAGSWLKGYLEEEQIHTQGLISHISRPTTLKRRFATKSQQLLRVDLEDASPISADLQEILLDQIGQMAEQIDAVILSDYRKGVFSSPDFVRKVIQLCKKHNILITVDSKSPHIEAFAGADFVKPNNLELEQAVGIKIVDESSLDAAGNCYLDRSGAKALLVTRGAKGISVFERGRARRDYPSRAVQVYDVTGAGDTVISTVTLCIACKMPLEEAVVFGNAAAEAVISKTGTVPVTAGELIRSVMERYERKDC